MYSPKISEDLIRKIYRISKEKKVPMTVLVDYILRGILIEPDGNGGAVAEITVNQKQRKIITGEILREYLKPVRIHLDCGHLWCLHNFSNTLIVTNMGTVMCHDCYL